MCEMYDFQGLLLLYVSDIVFHILIGKKYCLLHYQNQLPTIEVKFIYC